jgi:hypothetical protein
MRPIGFKQQNVKQPRRRKQQLQEEIIIPGTGMAHTMGVFMKIQELEEYMLTKQFSTLTKAKKKSIMETFKFMVTTLAMIQSPTVGNVMENEMNPIGFV